MKSRHGLGVLALCGLVFGLMALSATGAQAAGCTTANPTAKPCWMMNGTNITSTLKVEAEGTSDPNLPVLLTKSGANAIAIACMTIKASGEVLAEGILDGTVNFSNCTTTVNGVAHPECNPINQPTKWGGTLEIVLHEGVAYARATGVGGGAFATIKFNEICLLNPITISGTGWIKDCEGSFEKETKTHLIEEGKVPAEKLGGLKFGSNAVTIDESITIKLTDAAHQEMPFSGLAN